MLDTAKLQDLLRQTGTMGDGDFNMTEQEVAKMEENFRQPEFMKMFTEYMADLKDPKHREEQEAYISELEKEKKVPAGKRAVHPEAHCVIKTSYTTKAGGSPEKLFINVVSSPELGKPVASGGSSSSGGGGGTEWSLPNCVGPVQAVADRKGSSATAIDFCVHPDALEVGAKFPQFFSDLIVATAIDGAERRLREDGILSGDGGGGSRLGSENKGAQAVRNGGNAVSRTYHVLQGVKYKSGAVATMLVPESKLSSTKKAASGSAPDNGSTASDGGNGELKSAEPPHAPTESAGMAAMPAIAATGAGSKPLPPTTAAYDAVSNGAKTKQPAVSRGFLTKQKATAKKGSSAAAAVSASTGASAGSKSSIGVTTRAAQGPASGTAPAIAEPLIREVAASAPATAPATAATAKTTAAPLASPTNGEEGNQRTMRPRASAASAAVGAAAAAADARASSNYTITERGILDLGDHMHLPGDRGTSAAIAPPRRPKELVVRIKLPREAGPLRATEMLLDIGERALLLGVRKDHRYAEVPLPYPVDKDRGTARLLPGGGTLEVVMPVLPPPAPPQPPSDQQQQEREEENTAACAQPPLQQSAHMRRAKDLSEAAGGARLGASLADHGAAAAKAALPDHSRWVSHQPIGEKFVFPDMPQQAANGMEGSGDSGAALARTPAEAAAVAAAGIPLADRGDGSASEVTTQLSQTMAADRSPFLKCATFTGTKAGYTFKQGELGLGYYRDAYAAAVERAPSTAATAGTSLAETELLAEEKPAVAASAEDAEQLEVPDTSDVKDVDPLRPDFDWRENAGTVSIIVAVAAADAASIRVACQRRTIEMTLSAAGGGSSGGAQGSRYRLRLQLAGEVDPERVRHDVADQNVILVLGKAKAGDWGRLEAPEPGAATAPGPLKTAGIATSGAEASAGIGLRSRGAGMHGRTLAPKASVAETAAAAAARAAPMELRSPMLFELD